MRQTIDAAARARDPRVAQVSVGLSGTWSVVEIVRADGFVATDVRPLVRLNVSIVVEQNGRRETGTFGMGGRYLYDRLFEEQTWNRAVDEALRQALVNLDSVAAPAGEMTVLLGPGWPGIVLHPDGRYLAFGGNPAKVGTRVQDIPGIDGDRLVADIAAQAARGPGWVEYDITNPATGRVQTKMSFVQALDDLYLGCGVYKSLAARS